MFDRFRTIFVLLLLCGGCIAGTLFVTRWLPAWDRGSDKPVSSKPQQDVATKADAAKRTVPLLIRQWKEDHDNELKLTHLELANGASEFIESFAGFEDEIEQWGRRFRHYIRVSPTIAALGRQMPEPKEVDEAANSKAIRAAVRKFRQKLNSYELNVKRTRFAYSQKLRSITIQHPELNISEQLPPAKTQFEDEVLFAMWLEKREDKILELYGQKIDAYRRNAPHRPDFGFVIPMLRQLHFKDQGAASNATPQQRLRAEALLSLERLDERMREFAETPAARFVSTELSAVRANQQRSTELFQKQQFAEALELVRSTGQQLDRVVAEGNNRKDSRAAEQAEKAFRSYVSVVPEKILLSDGESRWQPFVQQVEQAAGESSASARKEKYERLLSKARDVVPKIALDTAWHEYLAQDYSAGEQLLEVVSRRLGQSDAASLLFHNVLRKDLGPILRKAEAAMRSVSHPRDRTLGWLAVAETCDKAGRVRDRSRALEQALSVLRTLTSERRSIYLSWLVSHQLAARHPKESADALSHAITLLEKRKRVAGHSDETMRISLAGLLHGLALRLEKDALVQRCQLVRDDAMKRYLASDLVVKYVAHHQRRARYSKRFLPGLQPEPAMKLHYDVLVQAGRGREATALATAKKSNLAYTWGWLAVVASVDPQMRTHIGQIAAGIQKRDGSTENKALRRDSYYVKIEGKSKRITARGLQSNDPNFYKQVAASMTGTGSVYSLERDVDLFDLLAHRQRPRVGSYQDRQRRERLRNLKEKGRFLSSQIDDTVNHELSRTDYFQLFQNGGDRQTDIFQVGRLLGIARAAIKTPPTLVRQ